MNPIERRVPSRTPTYSPDTGQRIYDTATVRRISQAALVRDRLTNGVSPPTVTRLAAMIAQMESQIQAPLLSVISAFSAFQRSMTFQHDTWSGHDVTHHFHDDHVSISYCSASGGVQQNGSLQFFATPPLTQPTLPTTQPQAREPAGSQASSQCIPLLT